VFRPPRKVAYLRRASRFWIINLVHDQTGVYLEPEGADYRVKNVVPLNSPQARATFLTFPLHFGLYAEVEYNSNYGGTLRPLRRLWLTKSILEVNNLQTQHRRGCRQNCRRREFSHQPGRNLAVVGESEFSKSVTSLSIMRLIASPPGRIAGGEMLLKVRIWSKSESEDA